MNHYGSTQNGRVVILLQRGTVDANDGVGSTIAVDLEVSEITQMPLLALTGQPVGVVLWVEVRPHATAADVAAVTLLVDVKAVLSRRKPADVGFQFDEPVALHEANVPLDVLSGDGLDIRRGGRSFLVSSLGCDRVGGIHHQLFSEFLSRCLGVTDRILIHERHVVTGRLRQ